MPRIRDIAPYTIRMPEGMKEKLTARAKANGRSLNSEMVMTLQESLERADPKPKSSAEHAAAIQAEEVKKMVFDTLVKIYEKNQ
ncbi:Arc family DNA-binding protein [Morganella morganii]